MLKKIFKITLIIGNIMILALICIMFYRTKFVLTYPFDFWGVSVTTWYDAFKMTIGFDSIIILPVIIIDMVYAIVKIIKLRKEKKEKMS